MAITKKQELFVAAYLSNGFNGSRAYKDVYKCKDSVARQNASELLAKPFIKALVEAEQAKIAETYEIKKEDIIKELNWVIENAKTELPGATDRANILKALDMKNRMAGNYAAEKTETTIKFDVDLSKNDEDSNG